MSDVRTAIALKLNKVWPYGANVLLYGWRETNRKWKGPPA